MSNMDQPPKNNKEVTNEETLLDIEQSIEDAKQSMEDAIWVLSHKKAIINLNPTDDELMEIADREEEIASLGKEIKNLENRKAQILNAQNVAPEIEPEILPEQERPMTAETQPEPTEIPEPEPTKQDEVIENQTPKPDSQQPETLKLEGEVKMFVEELKLESLLPKEFNKLTETQQTKVIQDLKRRIVDIVKSDAQTQYSEELKDRKKWNSGILKVFEFIESAQDALYRKEKDVKNIENDIFERFIKQDKANDLIKQDLGILVERTKGRDVMVENGKAYFNYFTGSSVIMAGEPNVHNFNEKAHSFVNMPYEWGQEKNGKNKKAYEKAKAEYEEARKQILEQENITPEEKAKLTQEMLETDNLVKMEQLLNTHPEFEKALKEFGETAKGIELAKNAKKFLKSVYSERGGLALLGAGARWSTKTLAIAVGGAVGTAITAISAPVIGGMVGYYRGKTRAKETLTERQIKARRGEKDESKEATNTEDIEKLNKRIEDVLGALERAGTDEEKAKKLDQIKRRIEYTQNKIEAGLVNFGDSKNALNNQFNLINNLNKALTISASLDQTTRKDIDARLKQFLSYKTKNITEAQKAFITKQARNSAIWGAGFALAGYGVRWTGEHFGWWGHTGEIKTDTPKITEETKLNTNHITKTPLISSHASVLQNTPKAVASHEQFRPITPASEPKTEAVESFTPPPEEAIVKNGKGIENAFINQLRTNADLREKLNATLGSSKGPDINDPKFPGWMAHRVALHFGYADANNQVLINRPGAIAFELKIDENGNPIVIEKTVDGTVLKEYGYEKGGYQFGKNPQNEYEYERINKVSVPHQDTGVIEPNDTETHTMGLKEKTLPIEAETLNVGTTEGAFSTEKHSLGIGAEKSFFADKIEKIKNIKEQIEANIDAENTKTAPKEIPRHLKLGEEGFLKFAKGNPYQLNEEGLHKSYSFFKRTINHYLNNGGKIEDWENIKNTNARNFIINESLEKQHKPIYEYLDMLKKVSGEPTLGWSFFHKADTVESYITRALQKLVSDGNLERFEEELRK